MAVASGSIVKDFDVIEDISASQVACFVDTLAKAFFLQAAEEGLGNRFIPTVSTAAHARLQIVVPGKSDASITAILAALIRMHEYWLCRITAPDCYQQRVQRQFFDRVSFLDQATTLRA